MRVYRQEMRKIKKFLFKNYIIDIQPFDKEPFEFSIISPSNLTFISAKREKIYKKINSNNDFFLNGKYRPKDGKIFAVGGKNKKIDLIDLKKNIILKTITAHRGSINALAFSWNQTQIISGGSDFIIKLWDISTQQCLISIKNEKNSVRSISFLPEINQIFASSSYDGKIKIFDFRFSKIPILIFDHGCPVENFKFSDI